MWAGSSASPSSKIFELNLPCYHPLAVFLPRLGFTSMLLLNRVRKYALVAIFRIHFLARKRCFLGGTDTSGGVETLRQSPGLLTDGGRRKKRDVDFTIPKHIGIRARVEYGFQRINHRIGERGAIQRQQPGRCGSNHWRPPRNRVRENPETRPATSPRAPAAATPSYHPDLTPPVSLFPHCTYYTNSVSSNAAKISPRRASELKSFLRSFGCGSAALYYIPSNSSPLAKISCPSWDRPSPFVACRPGKARQPDRRQKPIVCPTLTTQLGCGSA